MLDKSCSALMVLMFIGLLSGCKNTGTTVYPTEDRQTSGLFLDTEERAVLPPGVTLRRVYEKGILMTKASEGFRAHVYNDAGHYCTIGYGHLIQKAPCSESVPLEFRRGIAESHARKILVTDMEIAEIAVMVTTRIPLTDGQFAALCDFAFNVGCGNLRKSTLLQVINTRQFERVPGQFRRWVLAGNPAKVVPGLKARRERQIELFFDGIGVPKAAPPASEDLSPINIRNGE